MKQLNEIELRSVVGGNTSISATFINSIARTIESIMDLGRSFGNAIRRISSKNVCPF